MKRDLSNVTRGHLLALRRWLKTGNEEICPFTQTGVPCEEDICYQVFPTLKAERCPCLTFNANYVKKVAKQLIKELL